jgi:hypothetical protein
VRCRRARSVRPLTGGRRAGLAEGPGRRTRWRWAQQFGSQTVRMAATLEQRGVILRTSVCQRNRRHQRQWVRPRGSRAAPTERPGTPAPGMSRPGRASVLTAGVGMSYPSSMKEDPSRERRRGHLGHLGASSRRRFQGPIVDITSQFAANAKLMRPIRKPSDSAGSMTAPSWER